MRKYNNKTKKTIMIVMILCVGIVVIFSLFLKKSIDIGRTAYSVSSGSILFDKDENMITTSSSGTLRIKWGGDYYLIYDDKNYDLGSHSVIYDSNSGDISLYGKFYQVNKTGKVDTIKGENKIKSSVNSRFYKLADRVYLIIDRTIESKDSSFVTSNYLLVHLDKLGNATLLNDKTSFKTITPTVLRTSSYSFDIANEKINFGGEDIDLKKIIGSTNKYDKDTYNLNSTKNNDDTNGGTGTGTGGSGTGTGGSGSGSGGSGTGTGGSGTGGSGSGGDGTGTSGTGIGGTGTGGNGDSSAIGGTGITNNTGISNGVNSNGTTNGSNSTFNGNSNQNNGVSNDTVQQIINATKNTSVIRVSPEIDSISVDYVVYDPDNEYKSVYVEVENTVNSTTNVVYMSKTDTNLVIRDLLPNVYYNLKFKYTYYDNKKNLKEYKFDEVGLHTSLPQIYLNVTKISGNKLYYKISFDKNYTVTGGSVNLYLNDQFTGISSSVPVSGSVSSISGKNCYLDLSNLGVNQGSGNVLTVRLMSLNFNTYTINPGIDYKFRYQEERIMKKFEKWVQENYKLIIPISLIVVVFISFLVYYKLMISSNYHVDTEERVYQYFYDKKYEYTAVVSKNRKDVVVDYKPKNINVNIDSTPIYYQKGDIVLFPSDMSVVMPTLSCAEYLSPGYSYITYQKGIYNLTTNKYHGKLNHYFLFDGKDLYFFIEPVTLVIGSDQYQLSSYSYITTEHQGSISYYDKANDSYKTINVDDEDIYIKNDYYKVYILRDIIDYQGTNVILTSDLKELNTIEKKG